MTPPTELERLRAENERIKAQSLHYKSGEHMSKTIEDLRAENERLLTLLSGDDADLLPKWLAEAGPEAHAVHLAGVEHETELGKEHKRAEAWKAAAEALDGCVDWPKLPSGKVYSGYFTPEQDEAVTLLNAARQLEEPSE